jgi:hypothetical protein
VVVVAIGLKWNKDKQPHIFSSDWGSLTALATPDIKDVPLNEVGFLPRRMKVVRRGEKVEGS